jgi:hypothetical protein
MWAPPVSAATALTVTPNSDLGDGQLVTVHGTGFTPNVDIGYCEGIQDATPAQNDCGGVAGLTTSAADGSFQVNINVYRRINVPSLGRTVDCVVEQCYVAAAEFDHIAETAAYAPITFDPAQPDVRIKTRATGLILGDDVYNPTGASQSRNHAVAPGGRWTYTVQIQNDGPTTDDLTVSAPTPTDGFSVKYFLGYYDVTAAVSGAGFTFTDVGAGAIRTIGVQIRAGVSTPERAKTFFLVTARSDRTGALDAVGTGAVVRASV